ncbi:MAG TPA: Spy/CpxP family protein refolding chaperone [Gemmatimonadaceae bacterium]|jgi:hypothetical protein
MKQVVRVALALGLVTGAALAQNPPAAQPKPAPAPAGNAAAAQPEARRQMMAGQMDRAQLEQQIRNRIANQLRNQLQLTDDQFAKLQATNRKFEERRRLLVEQERDARMGMRDLLIAGDTMNQAKVSTALDRMLQIQRQRFELVEQEQKEMAGYLTPMQRARFLGMQEQMRRRMDEVRAQAVRRGMAGPGAGALRPGMGEGMGPGMGPGIGPGAGRAGAGIPQGQRLPRQGVRPPNAQQPPVPPEDNIPW